jgi:cysteine desulfurase
MHKAEQHLENEILACNAFILNAKNANRARSILSITIPGVHAQSLQQMITPYIVSIGSACNSLSAEPSRVLKAIGLGDGLANSTIRISIGRFTKIKDIDLMLEKLIHCSNMLKKISSDVPDWFLK